MSLIDALRRSINTIAVKLSISIGKGNPRLGRNMIVANAKKMGLRTPLNDTPSLPIGAGEVTVLDHTVAFATFPNGGRAVTAHGLLEVRSSTGEVVWRFDRDGPKPRQVFRPQTAHDMNMMLNKAAEEGTGRRARLDGVRIAGKTGTTNAYRDAWFVGFTGNFVAGVWIGNDDYSSTNRMTGGSLPAMTWQAAMGYAHQGIELRPIPGVPATPAPGPVPPRPAVAAASAKPQPPRPTVLSRRGADALVRLERLMDDAARALAVAGAPAAPGTTGTAAPTGRQSAVDKPDTHLAAHDDTTGTPSRN
jgi:penicillin-binding protein 1A